MKPANSQQISNYFGTLFGQWYNQHKFEIIDKKQP